MCRWRWQMWSKHFIFNIVNRVYRFIYWFKRCCRPWTNGKVFLCLISFISFVGISFNLGHLPEISPILLSVALLSTHVYSINYLWAFTLDALLLFICLHMRPQTPLYRLCECCGISSENDVNFRSQFKREQIVFCHRMLCFILFVICIFHVQIYIKLNLLIYEQWVLIRLIWVLLQHVFKYRLIYLAGP